MPRVKKDRTKQILQLLTQNGHLDVAVLSKELGVSQVTIRKDLNEMEAKGLLRRDHGAARLPETDNMASRLAYHYEEKKKIAVLAAELISDGDTVMIESGSCCALLAAQLAHVRRSLTIITNSVFITEYIKDYQHIQTILLGGIYQHDSQCLVGPMVREAAMNYHVKYFFVGTDGWNERIGFTNKDQLRAQAVRDMSASCEVLALITESEKFRHVGTVPLNVPDIPKILFTDEGLEESTRQILEKASVRIIQPSHYTRAKK